MLLPLGVKARCFFWIASRIAARAVAMTREGVWDFPSQRAEVPRGFFTQDLPCAEQSQQGRKGSRDKGCETCVEIKPRIAEFHDLGDNGLGDERTRDKTEQGGEAGNHAIFHEG